MWFLDSGPWGQVKQEETIEMAFAGGMVHDKKRKQMSPQLFPFTCLISLHVLESNNHEKKNFWTVTSFLSLTHIHLIHHLSLFLHPSSLCFLIFTTPQLLHSYSLQALPRMPLWIVTLHPFQPWEKRESSFYEILLCIKLTHVWQQQLPVCMVNKMLWWYMKIRNCAEYYRWYKLVSCTALVPG